MGERGLILSLLLLGVLYHGGEAQIPTVCADRESLETMTCCPVTGDGVCGEDAGRGQCVAVNFDRHSNDTTNVRVNWPHYYTRVCKCSGNFGGYDCSRCNYGYYGQDCSSKAIAPRKPLRDFSEEEWEELIAILRLIKTRDSEYKVVLEERVPGTADLTMTNISIFDLSVWLHHYAGKNGGDLFSPLYIDYAHIGPAFFTWHRWFSLFLETEIQAVLQSLGREDYYKYRLPYWDWRREIQTSYGLPSEELFSLNRFGETRNISNRPVVFGDLAEDWTTICHATVQICDPRISTGPIQRCPFIGNPILCHSSNPDWPSIQDVNKLFDVEDYAVAPYDFFSVGSFGALVDLPLVTDVDECREDVYCTCAPGGTQCEDENAASSSVKFSVGVHGKAHFLVGLGGVAPLPPELQGSMIDFGSAPNDPLFIPHHTMVDCILEEWMHRNPRSGYPASNEVRDGHKKDDYLRTFFPLVTNGDAFVDPRENFGYYCKLSNLDSNEAVAPSPLDTSFSVFVTGSSAEVCVETKAASIIKLVLRDADNKRGIRTVQGSSGCGTFTGLPAGKHRVRAISRENQTGKGERFTSEFFFFSTD